MKLLRDILYKVKLDQVSGLTNQAIETLTFDSRKNMKFCIGNSTRAMVLRLCASAIGKPFATIYTKTATLR